MNVGRYIRQAKQKFQTMRTENKKITAEKKAAELKELRKERLRLEGEAHLEKLKQQELSRINKAKSVKPNKLKSFGRGLAKVINKGKEGVAAAKKQGYLKGIDLSAGNSRSPFGGGSSGSKSPFGMSSKPATRLKVKKKVVTTYE